MKFDEKALANASAIWMSIVYLFCRFAIALFPGISLAVTKSWFHGFDVEKIWVVQPFSANFLLGLVTATALSWVGGWLFAYLYNRLVK